MDDVVMRFGKRPGSITIGCSDIWEILEREYLPSIRKKSSELRATTAVQAQLSKMLATLKRRIGTLSPVESGVAEKRGAGMA